jgi:hypothetical protein
VTGCIALGLLGGTQDKVCQRTTKSLPSRDMLTNISRSGPRARQAASNVGHRHLPSPFRASPEVLCLRSTSTLLWITYKVKIKNRLERQPISAKWGTKLAEPKKQPSHIFQPNCLYRAFASLLRRDDDGLLPRSSLLRCFCRRPKIVETEKGAAPGQCQLAALDQLEQAPGVVLTIHELASDLQAQSQDEQLSWSASWLALHMCTHVWHTDHAQREAH